MRIWLLIASLVCASPAFAEVSVTASVDQNRVAFGESVTFTILVKGAQSEAQPAIPRIDGLNFAGPSVSRQFSFGTGGNSSSMSLVYQLTPTHPGEFTIPAISVAVDSRGYQTEPIKLTVLPPDAQSASQQQDLSVRVRLDSQQVYIGQTAPLDVVVLARPSVPLKQLVAPNCEADGLGYKCLQNVKSSARIINGETVNVHSFEGAISPTKVGKLTFGPCIIRAGIAVPRKNRGGWPFGDSMFDEMMGRVELREQPVTLPEVPLEVLPLPEEGKPADFTGAVGQWNLEVTAKPTEVAVGDPITLTIKITGSGNIDTVATPQLKGLEDFKTYDPTSKTTKNELSTTGERVFQQVLVPKSTDVKQLPEIRLSYFDPVAKAYKTATQGPIQLVVKAGTGGAHAIVSGATRSRPLEKLGEDIVYLKGDLGAVETNVSWPAFWLLNFAPVVALAGGVLWKRRQDKLRGDVAYARRSRAARAARKLLATATGVDGIQHALQSYLGDRLNIPASGITVSVVDERRLPADVREVFETCDAARFAGVAADLTALKQKVEQVIDDLERANL
jgi:hypothetical protein